MLHKENSKKQRKTSWAYSSAFGMIFLHYFWFFKQCEHCFCELLMGCIFAQSSEKMCLQTPSNFISSSLDTVLETTQCMQSRCIILTVCSESLCQNFTNLLILFAPKKPIFISVLDIFISLNITSLYLFSNYVITFVIITWYSLYPHNPVVINFDVDLCTWVENAA